MSTPRRRNIAFGATRRSRSARPSKRRRRSNILRRDRLLPSTVRTKPQSNFAQKTRRRSSSSRQPCSNLRAIFRILPHSRRSSRSRLRRLEEPCRMRAGQTPCPPIALRRTPLQRRRLPPRRRTPPRTAPSTTSTPPRPPQPSSFSYFLLGTATAAPLFGTISLDFIIYQIRRPVKTEMSHCKCGKNKKPPTGRPCRVEQRLRIRLCR